MNNTMLLCGFKSGEIDLGIGRMSDPKLMGGLNYELLFLESPISGTPRSSPLQETIAQSGYGMAGSRSPKARYRARMRKPCCKARCKMPAGCIETLSASLSTTDRRLRLRLVRPFGAVKEDCRRNAGLITRADPERRRSR